MATSNFGLSNTSRQTAVVSLNQRKKIEPRRFVIPGGESLTHMIGQDSLAEACYNWLRSIRSFSSVRISLAKDPDSFRTTTKMVEAFPKDARPVWESPKIGRRGLANQIASILSKEKALCIDVKREGIFVVYDNDNKFSPTRPATPSDIKVLQEQDPDVKIGVGDMVHNEAWEPFIEFVPNPTGR